MRRIFATRPTSRCSRVLIATVLFANEFGGPVALLTGSRHSPRSIKLAGVQACEAGAVPRTAHFRCQVSCPRGQRVRPQHRAPSVFPFRYRQNTRTTWVFLTWFRTMGVYHVCMCADVFCVLRYWYSGLPYWHLIWVRAFRHVGVWVLIRILVACRRHSPSQTFQHGAVYMSQDITELDRDTSPYARVFSLSESCVYSKRV